MSRPLRPALDWGRLTPLRLRARTVAEGVYAGGHRSPRRGTGVEFGGHRNYVPGDDLRFIDRHALMRHGRLVVREFETETDRTVRLIVDASKSMAYASGKASNTKLDFAALLAASLGRIAVAAGDPVALDWLGGAHCTPLPPSAGREAFEHLVDALERAMPGEDLSANLRAVERTLAPIVRRARRGAQLLLFSDLLDLPDGTLERVAALATHGRTLIVIWILDPRERRFDFSGPVRLRASEGSLVVETDAAKARGEYLRALDALGQRWAKRVVQTGGGFVRAATDEDPITVVRAVVNAAAPGGR